MSRRPAAITKSELDRLIRAGRDAGLREVLIEVNGVKVVYPLDANYVDKSKSKLEKKRRALI